MWIELPKTPTSTGKFLNLDRIVYVEEFEGGRILATFANEASDAQYPSGSFWLSKEQALLVRAVLLGLTRLSGGDHRD